MNMRCYCNIRFTLSKGNDYPYSNFQFIKHLIGDAISKTTV